MSTAAEARSAGLLDGARRTIAASRPRSPHAHVLAAEHGSHLFLPNGSRLFDIPPDLSKEVEEAIDSGTVEGLLDRLRLAGTRYVDDAPFEPPAVHALSLAVAQACNLACSYCYAQQGAFGGAARSMPLEVAERSVDLLVGGAAPGARLNLAFLGGEPLVNRAVLRAATLRATELATERGVTLTFSITTNGTLLTRGRRRVLRGARLRGHDQPRRSARGTRRSAAVPRRPLELRRRDAQRGAAPRAAAAHAGVRARDRHAAEPDGASHARRARGGRLPQRRLLGHAQRPDRRGRAAARRSRDAARRDDRLRPGVRAAGGCGAALPVCQPGQRAPRDRPRHAPALSVRRGRGLPRRLGRGRAVRVPPVRRRLRGGDGLRVRGRRPAGARSSG